jgi:hypothetical protein
MPKSLKCPQCGAELDPDSRFCDACGARIEVAKPEPPVEPAEPEPGETKGGESKPPGRSTPSKVPTRTPAAKSRGGRTGGRGRPIIAWSLAILFALIGFAVALYGTSFDFSFSLFLGTVILLVVAVMRQYRALGPVALTMAVLMIAATTGPLVGPKNQSEDDQPGPDSQPGYEGLVPLGRWSDTYGAKRALKEVTGDRVIGEVIAGYEDRVETGEGLANSTSGISMQTLLFDLTETAKRAMREAEAEIESGENYIATARINGVEFVIYEGNSLGFIGSFANSLFHATYDVSADTVTGVRSGLGGISSTLPEIDLYHDLELPELSWALDPIADLMGTAVDHVARMTKQMISRSVDIALIAGEITGINEGASECYSLLKERGRRFVDAKVDALAAGTGTAADAASALSEIAMVAIDYASIVDADNVRIIYNLTGLLSREVVERAITSAEVIKHIAGGRVGLVIDDDGVTINLLGSHSFRHELLGLAVDAGLRRFEVTLLGDEAGEARVALETGIGFSLEISSRMESTGVEISGNVKFEGDRVRSDLQNLIGMAAGEWLTVWDWANLTIGYGLGSGIPDGAFLVPGMDVLVEISRSIGENRVARMTFDPSPEIQVQAQAGAEIEVSAHAVVGGEGSVAGAVNLGLDFSRAKAELGRLLDPGAAGSAARNISVQVAEIVEGVIDIDRMADPETLDEHEMGTDLRVEYLNAVAHRDVTTSAGNLSALQMESNPGEIIALYLHNLLGESMENLAVNSNLGLCLKGKGGVGVGAGTTGGELAADFEIGLEGGLNTPTTVLIGIGATSRETREEIVNGLCEKGYRLLSDPSRAGSFIDDPGLALDAETLEALILSLSEYRLESGISEVVTSRLSEMHEELEDDAEFRRNLARSDLYFQISIGAKGSAELGLGTEVEGALQAVLHNNGENILNNLGEDTEELQRSTLTIGLQIAPPSLEIEAVPGTNLFVEASIGGDFLQIELAQKRNRVENVVDLFSEIFPITPREPEAGMAVDLDSWAGTYDLGEEAKQVVTVSNTGDMAVNVVARSPADITTDIPEGGLEIGAGATGRVAVSADTSTQGTIQGDLHLLTGFEGCHQSITVNLIIAPGEASISVDESTWEERVRRGTETSKVFLISNTGGAEYAGDVILPEWASAGRASVTVPARSSSTLTVDIDTSLDRTLTGQLVLRSSEEGDTPLVSITVQVGSPDISLDTDSINMQLDPGQAATATIQIRNRGIFDLTVEIGETPGWVNPGLTTITVPVGQTAQLELELTATGPALEHGLVLTTDDPDTPALTVPIRVTTVLEPETLERVHVGSHHVTRRLDLDVHGGYVTFVGPYDRETAEGGGTYGSSWNDECVYLYDDTRGELQRISAGSTHRDWPIHYSYIVAGPAIHGDRVVYGVKESYSNVTSQHYWNYDYRYFLYDIPTGQTTELDIPFTDMGKTDGSHVFGDVDIDIYDNLIVGHTNSEIWVYDLDQPGTGVRTIAQEKGPTGPLTDRVTTLQLSSPAIHGDRVVYVNTDESYHTSDGYTNYTVWIVDLNTQRETCLGWSKVWSWPVISRDYVVFESRLTRDTADYALVVYDLETGQTTLVGRGPSQYLDMDIDEENLAYMNLSQKGGTSFWAIHHRDLATGDTVLITRRAPDTYVDGARLPAVYGDRVYYLDVIDGWTYLKAATIP